MTDSTQQQPTPTIADEAVEAAYNAWLQHAATSGSWALNSSLRAALEAAPPFIRAQALEEAERGQG